MTDTHKMGRVTIPHSLGRDRQPSAPVCSPSKERISGLMSSTSPSPTSMTHTCLKTPTWGAASPAPLAS